MTNVALPHFLSVAAILFGLGLVTVLTRRNAVGLLMGVELILNAANLNLVAFARFVERAVSGQVFALLVIALAAAEAAVALAIVLSLFRGTKTIDVRETTELRE